MKRGAASPSWRSGATVGSSIAVHHAWTRSSSTRCLVGVTDVGPGAKTTMNIIAA
jgi:hypothetical protein